MSTRPRRHAAQRASQAITDLADRDRESDHSHGPISSRMSSFNSSSRSRLPGKGIASVSRSEAGGASDPEHIHLTVKLPSSKLRQATSSSGIKKAGSVGSSSSSSGGGKAAVKRARGGKRSRVLESSEEEEEENEVEVLGDEDEEEEEEEDEIEVREGEGYDEDEEEDVEDEDEEMQDLGEEDADGEDDEMDVDAEGEEDADGDVNMDAGVVGARATTVRAVPPAIKVTKPPKESPSNGKAATASKANDNAVPVKRPAPDSDDESLSSLESEPEEEVNVAGGEDAEGEDDDAEGEVDAEGEEEEEEEEEIEVADEDAEGEDVEQDEDEDEEEEDDDDEMISRAQTPDMSRLTARQRARLGEASGEYLKLSDGTFSSCLFFSPYCHNMILAMSQKSNPKNTSPPKSCPCAARKWPVAAATCPRSATRKLRWRLSTSCSRSRRRARPGVLRRRQLPLRKPRRRLSSLNGRIP